MNHSSFAIEVDELTLARARKGHRDAQAYLYRSFSSKVYSLALRLCQSSSDAEDVTHDVFIDCFNKLHQFRGDAPFWGWLRRITVNTALMKIRRYNNEPIEAIDEDRVDHQAVESGEQVAQQLDMETLLQHLSPTARIVVWLYDVEGYTHEEIGQLMHKTTSFSKSQRARAYAKLRSIPQWNNTQIPQNS